MYVGVYVYMYIYMGVCVYTCTLLMHVCITVYPVWSADMELLLHVYMVTSIIMITISTCVWLSCDAFVCAESNQLLFRIQSM